MTNKLYKNYADQIATYLNEGKRGTLQKSNNYSNFTGNSAKETQALWRDKYLNENNFNSLNELNIISGSKLNYHLKLGAHPDFSHLKDANKTEHHYITTMFIDIKKSTDLFKKYYPLTVAKISRTIQDAAIHTCWHFNGYVHRLQGDGLMVYFGGKDTSIAESTANACNAAAFFTYFVKNDLKEIFIDLGVERIYTRIGIDTGEAEDVLWHLAGMGECSEITTCSLHSSLASKMQTQTKSNGIMVGDNVLKYKMINEEYFKKTPYQSNGTIRDYVFSIPEESFYYRQHEFDWERYLKNHPAVEADENGCLKFKGGNELANSNITQQLPYMQKYVSDYKPSFR